jgi:hypothetical protein
MSDTITLDDGRVFPCHGGKVLSWSIGLYHTSAEELIDFPLMRAVVRAMLCHRPAQLDSEILEMKKSCYDRLFGHNARKCLDVILSEVSKQRCA